MRALLLATIVAVGVPGMARADAIIFNGLGSSEPFDSLRGPSDAPLGNVMFSQKTTITRFGVYDAMSGAGTQTFYIFNSSGQRVYASAPKAFAGDGGTGPESYSYKVSDPFSFTFQAGTTYELGATASVDTGYYAAYDAVTQNGITMLASNGNVYLGNATMGGGCCSTGVVLYAASDAAPAAVPEPASLVLLGVAAVAVVGRRRVA